MGCRGLQRHFRIGPERARPARASAQRIAAAAEAGGGAGGSGCAGGSAGPRWFPSEDSVSLCPKRPMIELEADPSILQCCMLLNEPRAAVRRAQRDCSRDQRYTHVPGSKPAQRDPEPALHATTRPCRLVLAVLDVSGCLPPRVKGSGSPRLHQGLDHSDRLADCEGGGGSRLRGPLAAQL